MIFNANLWIFVFLHQNNAAFVIYEFEFHFPFPSLWGCDVTCRPYSCISGHWHWRVLSTNGEEKRHPVNGWVKESTCIKMYSIVSRINTPYAQNKNQIETANKQSGVEQNGMQVILRRVSKVCPLENERELRGTILLLLQYIGPLGHSISLL